MHCKCPKCQSNKVRSYDNETLGHKTKEDAIKEEYNDIIDNEVYVSLVCDDCQHEFTQSFKLMLDINTGDKLAMEIVLDHLDNGSDMHTSIKKIFDQL